MAGIEPIDVSAMFPDYERAEAVRDGSDATVRLYSGGTYATIRMNVDAMYQVLGDLRKIR